ncbi:MAG: hypothetical protein NT075_16585 [Chloroflexi bacterium]|nr:hypothetical protein [Chloroflexota bacterium]
MIDIHTLTTLQNERYDGFVRRAKMLRLLQLQNETNNLNQPPVTKPTARKAAPNLYQMVVTAMQTHIRTLLSH